MFGFGSLFGWKVQCCPRLTFPAVCRMFSNWILMQSSFLMMAFPLTGFLAHWLKNNTPKHFIPTTMLDHVHGVECFSFLPNKKHISSQTTPFSSNSTAKQTNKSFSEPPLEQWTPPWLMSIENQPPAASAEVPVWTWWYQNCRKVLAEILGFSLASYTAILASTGVTFGFFPLLKH